MRESCPPTVDELRLDIARWREAVARVAHDAEALSPFINAATQNEDGEALDHLWARRRTLEAEREDCARRLSEAEAALQRAAAVAARPWEEARNRARRELLAERERRAEVVREAVSTLLASLEAYAAHPDESRSALRVLNASRERLTADWPDSPMPAEASMPDLERDVDAANIDGLIAPLATWVDRARQRYAPPRAGLFGKVWWNPA